MTRRPCSECQELIEQIPGRPAILTCGDECRARRANRLRNARRNPAADSVFICSECDHPVQQRATSSRGRPFLTCSPECFALRNQRLQKARYASHAAQIPGAYCIDCSTPFADHVRRSTRRCPPCRSKHRFALAQKRDQRNADKRAAREQRATWSEEQRQNQSRRRLNGKLRSMYGITLEHFEAMLQAQNGRCAICGNLPAGRGKGGTLVVDHCHKKGHVRALLCGQCNIALGLLEDNPTLTEKAGEYLRYWSLVEDPALSALF